MPAAPLSSASAAESADELSEEALVAHSGTVGAIGCRATGEEEQGIHPVGEGGGEAQRPQAALERTATSATSSAASPTGVSTAAFPRENERVLPPTCGSHYVVGRFRLTACERLPLC